MRRSLVGLVLALAVLGAGCSSPPQSTISIFAAQQNVATWASAVRADTKAEAKECLATSRCALNPALKAKTRSDEAHLAQAQAALERAAGHTAFHLF
ncbi:MAG: hypothetical protein WBG41_14935 [Acidimicrobiales bacterium]